MGILCTFSCDYSFCRCLCLSIAVRNNNTAFGLVCPRNMLVCWNLRLPLLTVGLAINTSVKEWRLEMMLLLLLFRLAPFFSLSGLCMPSVNEYPPPSYPRSKNRLLARKCRSGKRI